MLERVGILGLLVHQMADEMIVGLIQVAEVRYLLAQIITLLLLELFQGQIGLGYLMEDLLSVRSDQEVLYDLGALLFGNLVYVPEECEQ